ncbi:MAG TPA: VOC family protein [Candidatus Acidoferrales bacterium]|jgi:PhnB protein|nr:VOC family protein [Candidatus Acidoferrales bacterium]
MAKVKPIPDGYHSITPYLFIKGAADAIDYYKSVFGAKERMRMPGPNGRIMHAELQIGDSVVMLADENLEIGAKSPKTLGGVSSSLHTYFENVDKIAEKAVSSGAKLVRPVKDEFYGDRTATIVDPFGHMWSIATHIEDVSPEEMQKRMSKATSQAAAG